MNDGTSYYGREILPNNSSMFSGYHANLWRNYPYYNSKIIQSKKFEFIGVARLFEGDTEIEAVAVLQIGSRPYIVNPILKTSKRTGLRPGFFRYGQYFNNANGPRKNITHFSWVKSNSADVPLVGSTEVFSKYEISKFPGASAVANNPPILPENGELSPYSVDREKILKDIMNLFEWKNLVRDDYSQYLKDTSKDLSYYMNQSEKEFESKIVKYNSNDFKQFVQERILALSELDTDIITYLNKFLNTGCLRKG